MNTAKLVSDLTVCADDPMWANHAEVPKKLLSAAAACISARAQVMLAAADLCDSWAIASQSGGWSTHQVEANRRLAQQLRDAAR